MHPFFAKRQNDLLWLANSEAGRYLLGIKDKNRIIKLTPNSFHQLRDFRNNRPIIQAQFYTQNIVAKIFLPLLAKMEIADREYKHIDDPYEAFLHYAGFQRSRQYPQIYLTTNTFTPASSAGSGRVYGQSYENWAKAWGGTDQVYTGTDFYFAGVVHSGNYAINRTFFCVNTSSIGTGQIINSSFMRTYSTSDSGNPFSDSIDVVSDSQALPTVLTTSDYTTLGTTVFYSIAIASMNIGAGLINDFSLNSSGLANIVPTGYSKFGVRTELDRANFAPGGAGTGGYWFIYATPYLSVTYTPATFIKAVSSVAYASIKKISGVAIASVKKVAGLS